MLTEPMPMSIIKNNRHAAVSAINVIVCRKLCIISAKLAIFAKFETEYCMCVTTGKRNVFCSRITAANSVFPR
jgi:hypothetical protein